MTTLLVTVGSTLFNDLIHAVLENTTLRLLSSLGVTDLVVQYGNGKLPSGLFQKGEVNAKGEGRVVFRIKQAGSDGEGEALGVKVLRFTDDLGGLIESSNAVVSHAGQLLFMAATDCPGSGTILQTLRTPQPLLVVPNTKLMYNHQMELATALEAEKYILVCTSEVE
jgi:beta-1,4-N-acetylglucosaminyltransferase